MNSRYFLLGVMLVLTLTATGCGRFSELDETAFVFTMTIDKGEHNRMKIGVRVPVPRLVGKIQGQAAGAGGGPGQEPYANTQVDAATISDGMTIVQLYTGREISLEHLRALLVSEDVARTDIEPVIRALMRNPEVRSSTQVFVVRGSAYRLILENNPILEVNTSKFVDLVSSSEKLHGLIKAMSIGDFYSQMMTEGVAVASLVSINEPVAAARKAKTLEAAGGTPAPDKAGEADRAAKDEAGKQPEKPSTLPPARTAGSYLAGHLPRTGGNAIEHLGLGVFDQSKMVGVLNGNSTLAYNLITGNFQNGRVTVAEPRHAEHLTTLRVYKGRNPEVRVNLAGNRPLISVHIVVDCDLEVVTSGEKVEDRNFLPKLEDAVAVQLTRWIEAAVKQTQEWGTDIFGFYRHTRRHYPTWDEWQKLNWNDLYKKAKVDINVTAHVRRPGLIIGTTSAY